MPHGSWAGVLILVLGWLTSGVAWAQTATVEELTRVGHRAHRLGRYAFAAHAFKEAYLAQPDASLTFAIADAYHQRFLAKREGYPRVQAITYYGEYLAAKPRGPKSERARRALAYLEGVEQPIDDDAMAAAVAAEAGATRIAVLSSALGAVVRVDGKRKKLPWLSTIAPGKHRIVVSAAGYEKELRKLTLAKGHVHVVEVKLQPEPAKLRVATSVGASVYVDGRFVGVAPFEEAIDVEPGKRVIDVALNGHELHSSTVTLKRGKEHEIEVDLIATGQRVGAGLLVGAGAVGVAVGIVFGVLSTVDVRAAADTNDFQEKKRLRTRADEYNVLAGLAAGVGFGWFLAGGVLFIFDEPEVTLAPEGPGLGGVTLEVRF